jgi:hypothetical protein
MLEGVKLLFGIPSDLTIDPNGAALEMYRVSDDIPGAETGNVALEMTELVHYVWYEKDATIFLNYKGQWGIVGVWCRGP